MQSPSHQQLAMGAALTIETISMHGSGAANSPVPAAATPSENLRRAAPVTRKLRLPGPAVVVTLLVLLVDSGWMAIGGWHMLSSSVVGLGVALAACLTPLCFARYRDDVRIASTLRASALLIAFTGATAILSYLIVSTNASLVDTQLASWDRAIGFDWLELLHWMQAHPLMHGILKFAYASGLPQMAGVVVFLGFTGRDVKLNEFMHRFMAATLIVIAFSWPFPAAGPWTHYSLSAMVDSSSMSHFQLLRDGSLRMLDLRSMQGLISIPSLHTALAVLLACAMHGTRLFWPFAVLNGLMVLATPIEGGHYLVDVVAGAALAFLLIVFRSTRP